MYDFQFSSHSSFDFTDQHKKEDVQKSDASRRNNQLHINTTAYVDMADTGNNEASIRKSNNNQLSSASSNSISAFGLNNILESENQKLFNQNIDFLKQVNKMSSINTTEDGLIPIKKDKTDAHVSKKQVKVVLPKPFWR